MKFLEFGFFGFPKKHPMYDPTLIQPLLEIGQQRWKFSNAAGTHDQKSDGSYGNYGFCSGFYQSIGKKNGKNI